MPLEGSPGFSQYGTAPSLLDNTDMKRQVLVPRPFDPVSQRYPGQGSRRLG